MEITKDTKICYFTVQTNSGKGYICMALKRPTKGSDDNFYKAAFSCYSPNEVEPFTKAKAREIAVGRLNSWRKASVQNGKFINNSRIVFDFEKVPSDPEFKIMNVVVRGLKTAIDGTLLPGWVLRAAKKSNIFGGLAAREKLNLEV